MSLQTSSLDSKQLPFPIVVKVKKQHIYNLILDREGNYDSADGIHWDQARNFEISDRTITWENGRQQQFTHLERPQVLLENGEPVALMCAADTLDENNVRQSFNVQIPLLITR